MRHFVEKIGIGAKHVPLLRQQCSVDNQAAGISKVGGDWPVLYHSIRLKAAAANRVRLSEINVLSDNGRINKLRDPGP